MLEWLHSLYVSESLQFRKEETVATTDIENAFPPFTRL
jgi:hypothetical protein